MLLQKKLHIKQKPTTAEKFVPFFFSNDKIRFNKIQHKAFQK